MILMYSLMYISNFIGCLFGNRILNRNGRFFSNSKTQEVKNYHQIPTSINVVDTF